MDLNGTSTEHTISLFIDRVIRKDGNDVELIHRKFDEEINIPYDYIAKVIYESDDISSNESKIEQLDNNISFILESYEGTNKDTLENNLEKIANNYRLSLAQKDFIVKTTKSVEKRVSDLDQKLKNLEESTKNAKENLEKIEDTKSSIYTDFIAILGVFSSFVFVMFGGFSSLSEIIATLSSKKVSVPITLMISSFLMASMFTIVYSLIVWIAKVIGKSIIVKSCECNICRDPWHMFLRHKLYSIIMTTLVAVFIISLGVIIFVNIGYEFQTINVSRFILLSNLTLIVVLTLLYCFRVWIAKFTGKSFKKCYSPKCQGDCLHKYKHLFYRDPFYFCVISILIFFICIPYIYQFIDKYVVEWILN